MLLIVMLRGFEPPTGGLEIHSSNPDELQHHKELQFAATHKHYVATLTKKAGFLQCCIFLSCIATTDWRGGI